MTATDLPQAGLLPARRPPRVLGPRHWLQRDVLPWLMASWAKPPPHDILFSLSLVLGTPSCLFPAMDLTSLASLSGRCLLSAFYENQSLRKQPIL